MDEYPMWRLARHEWDNVSWFIGYVSTLSQRGRWNTQLEDLNISKSRNPWCNIAFYEEGTRVNRIVMKSHWVESLIRVTYHICTLKACDRTKEWNSFARGTTFGWISLRAFHNLTIMGLGIYVEWPKYTGLLILERGNYGTRAYFSSI